MSHHEMPSDPLCAGSLLASTLALMTMWASPCPGCSAEAGVEVLRASLAEKIAGQLLQLQVHPDVGSGLRNAAAQLQRKWLTLTAVSAADEAPEAEVPTIAIGPRSGALH